MQILKYTSALFFGSAIAGAGSRFGRDIYKKVKGNPYALLILAGLIAGVICTFLGARGLVRHYDMGDMTRKVKEWGLRSKKGHHLTKSVIHRLLQQPFYYGEMEVTTSMMTVSAKLAADWWNYSQMQGNTGMVRTYTRNGSC